jgi:Putative inner membrane protein (DUF1819)
LTADEGYTIRTSKGAALISETRVLLRAWNGKETEAELAQRALRDDLLGKVTAKRVKDLVQQVFARRYLRPEGPPAVYLKTLLERRPGGDWFRDLCLVYSARADRVLRDLVSVFFRDMREAGRLTLNLEAVIAFLSEAEEEGKLPRPWSPETKKKIARGLMKMLTEFGFLGNRGRGPREMRPFRPHPLAIGYLAFDLHFDGNTDAGVTGHPDWALWLLSEQDVREALDDLSRHGPWVFQSAGAVVRITWNAASMKEAVDVLARLDV